MKVLIRTESLSKYYGKGGEIKAVDELDLEVYEGETFGLLGPNGAGKTTTSPIKLYHKADKWHSTQARTGNNSLEANSYLP